MAIYQQISIETGASIGVPGSLPHVFDGLADGTLADISAHLDRSQLADPSLSAYAGTGFIRQSDPPPPPPEIISRMQLRRQLLTMPRTDGQTSAGKLRDQIDAGIAASSDLDLIEYWNETSDFHRHHPKVEVMLSVFSITDAQADAAWVAAAQLT